MAEKRIRALFLDLDDTLLINNTEAFLSRYFQALISRMQQDLPAEPFIQALREATHAMAINDGRNGTNEQVFDAVFYPKLRRSKSELYPLFDSFYTQEFELLRRYTEPDPMARAVVELAFAQGYHVVIATQPLFPRLAILARLRWAGVGAEEFAYAAITSYETMSACKPHPHFFTALAQRVGCDPHACLMVGDDLSTDMPARRVGCKTFWVDRDPVPRPSEIVWDAAGSLSDLYTLMQTGGIHEL